MTVELDPRWDWVHVPSCDDPDLWVRGRCNHLELESVEDVEGERVAVLCRICDVAWRMDGSMTR